MSYFGDSGFNADCPQSACGNICCFDSLPTPDTFYSYNLDHKQFPDLSPIIFSVVGVIGLVFVLICMYFFCTKYQRWVSSGDAPTSLNSAAGPPSENCPAGLDESVIRSIKVMKYQAGDTSAITDCSICLCEFRQDECLRVLPNCKHAFHVSCIDKWLMTQANCPLCRVSISLDVVVLASIDVQDNVEESMAIVNVKNFDDHRIEVSADNQSSTSFSSPLAYSSQSSIL